jgi:hypothetical protein
VSNLKSLVEMQDVVREPNRGTSAEWNDQNSDDITTRTTVKGRKNGEITDTLIDMRPGARTSDIQGSAERHSKAVQRSEVEQKTERGRLPSTAPSLHDSLVSYRWRFGFCSH